MKKFRNLFLVTLLVAFSILLTGCSFLLTPNDSNSNDKEAKIEDFDFVTDEKMVFENSSTNKYYCLTLYAGENYQIKTTIDDKLGDDYYLTYKIDDELNGEFTLSEDGYIQTNPTLEKGGAFAIDVDLYEKGSYKPIDHKYFIFSLMTGEYANIVLNNENLEFDSNTSTYSFTMNSGNNFNIAYSVSRNTSYVISFSLTDPSYSSFMSVDNNGKISTLKTNENKIGEIAIKTIGANGVLDTVFLKVNINKAEDYVNEFKVFNQENAALINNGDTLDLYNESEVSFDILYNNESKTNAITVSNPDVLEVDNTTNTIKAIGVGTSEVVFAYEGEKIAITINVIKNKVASILTENEGNDLVIINDTLHYLNEVYAIYESGAKKEISDLSLIEVSIADKNESYKTVTLTYTEDGEQVKVTYDVKLYLVVEYKEQTTAYNANDYLNNYYNGISCALPNSGTLKLLVIPVWFEDSDLFFNESQKVQIVEDIEYSMNGNRPSSEFKSVKQYYEAQSYGAITMDITVSDFYSSSTSYKDYSDYMDTKTNNARVLGTDAISWYFENNTDEKLDDYDLNNDGYLDGLVLFYGSNYYGDKNDENRSVAFETTNNDNNNYSFNTLVFCPIGGMYGLSKKEPTTQLETDDLSETYSRSFEKGSKTVIHEIGHMFGNDDLYEEQFASERYSPAGAFVMQDSNYGGHDPYHANKIGWTKPHIYASSDYQLGDKITIHLEDFQSSGQNIILTNKWNSSNSLYDEYMILELFTPTGLNEYDAKRVFMNSLNSGIRLWHVNSVLTDFYDGGNKTSQIIDGHLYDISYSNNDVESEFDLLHMIRNNANEPYNTNNNLYDGNTLFEQGDSFDMETFKSQFVNGSKLDSGEKLGWAFTVEYIYENVDGTYGAVITLERTDNVRTEFSKSVALNRSDLEAPDGEEEYGDEIFGEDGEFSLVYKYVTPPSYYDQVYPISSKGMCLFASSDGNGGYIDLTIKEIDGKEVCINSISITYSRLTNASLTVIAGENEITGEEFELESKEVLGYKYEVNAPSVRIQNQYDETINHWSVIAVLEITINYTIK